MLTAAVIGCGLGGKLSLDALHQSSGYRVVAASDISVAAGRTAAGRFPGLRVYEDYREMISRHPVDVVCIATPAPTHEPVARDVMNHGVRGLLLEKPVACDVTTAEKLLADVVSAQLPLVVPHGMLVLPAPVDVKRQVQSDAVGRITRMDVTNAVDLLNGGIHWLVFLLDVLGNDRVGQLTASFDVDGRIVNDGVHVESRGTTHLTTQSGIRITLQSGIRTRPTSDILPLDQQRGAIFRIRGSAGDIEFSAWAGSYWLGSDSGGELVRCVAESDPRYHQVFLDRLAEQIAGPKPDYYSAELSVAALRLIETAYQSHDGDDWPLGQPLGSQVN